MPVSRTRPPRPLVLHHKVPIEVTPLPFQPLEAIQHLDLDALARAKSARIEVGHFETDCCHRVVHAVIRDGKLTTFEVEPCKEPVPMTPEWKSILRDAHRALRA